MDIYGIGNSLKAMLEIYIQSCRGTGRTTAMLKGLQDGDIVVCYNKGELLETEQLLRKTTKSVRCIHANGMGEAGNMLQQMKRQGRVVLSHMFVEEFYRHNIQVTTKSLEGFETAFGFQPPPIRTAEEYDESQRNWRKHAYGHFDCLTGKPE